MLFKFRPRPCLRDISPYIPGKSIASVEREFGIKRVVKIASNENPLGPSPKAVKAFMEAAKDLAIYPEGSSPDLRRAIARHHGWKEPGIIIGNGSDEIIRLVCEAFIDPGDQVVLSQHAFLRFKQQALLMGAKIREAPMKNWTHDLDAMARAAYPAAKVVFIASPNNPTGTYNTRAQLRRFLSRAPKSAVVVLDEAYCHFAGAAEDYPRSIPDLLADNPNLIVLRTLSKAHGLAGLRLGYGAAWPEMIEWLDRIRMPFNVNSPAQKAAVAALKDEAFVAQSAALVRREMPKLVRSLGKCGFRVEGGNAANFVFARSPVPGAVLFRSLLRRGVIIRPLDEYGLTDYVRISVGSQAQNRALVSALKNVLDGGTPDDAAEALSR
ncbi:MAG: histidinol-phosphate transaminase [Elusimicrobiota bacterium]